jgi:ATP synthase F1 complex assembly factor 2
MEFWVLCRAYALFRLHSGFERAVITSKSFLIGLALTERRITGLEAADASRVEVLAQIAQWGEVKDAHDVDQEDIYRAFGSIAIALSTSGIPLK